MANTLKSLPTEINSIDDVWCFFNYLLFIEGVAFHPENSFEDYINEEGEPTYTFEEAQQRDALMEECYDVCDEYGIDIFLLGMESFNTFMESEKRFSNQAQCIEALELVSDETGQVFNFIPNQNYKIINIESIMIFVEFDKNSEAVSMFKWDYRKYFKTLEELEDDALKYNL